MQDSRCFSERCARVWLAFSLLVVGAAGFAGCATVRPEDREYLAEPALTWGGEGMAEAHERHVLDNREGSTGGGNVHGGGCGCN